AQVSLRWADSPAEVWRDVELLCQSGGCFLVLSAQCHDQRPPRACSMLRYLIERGRRSVVQVWTAPFQVFPVQVSLHWSDWPCPGLTWTGAKLLNQTDGCFPVPSALSRALNRPRGHSD